MEFRCILYAFSSDGIARITYEETEYYLITKDFLDSRSSFLRHRVDAVKRHRD